MSENIEGSSSVAGPVSPGMGSDGAVEKPSEATITGGAIAKPSEATITGGTVTGEGLTGGAVVKPSEEDVSGTGTITGPF